VTWQTPAAKEVASADRSTVGHFALEKDASRSCSEVVPLFLAIYMHPRPACMQLGFVGYRIEAQSRANSRDVVSQENHCLERAKAKARRRYVY